MKINETKLKVLRNIKKLFQSNKNDINKESIVSLLVTCSITLFNHHCGPIIVMAQTIFAWRTPRAQSYKLINILVIVNNITCGNATRTHTCSPVFFSITKSIFQYMLYTCLYNSNVHQWCNINYNSVTWRNRKNIQSCCHSFLW